MLFSYFQKRISLNNPELLELIETLPEHSKEKVMSTYDKIVAMGKQIGQKQGLEQGIEIKTSQFVSSLIQSTDWNDAKIALIANADIALVRKLRSELQG